MDSLKSFLLVGVSLCGGLAGFLFGEWHTFLTVLIVMQVLDIITGIAKAIYNEDLSSRKSTKGILKKAGMWGAIVLAHMVDLVLFSGSHVVRTGVLFMYIATEGLSITENLAQMDVIVNENLIKYLRQIEDKSKEDTETKKEE